MTGNVVEVRHTAYGGGALIDHSEDGVQRAAVGANVNLVGQRVGQKTDSLGDEGIRGGGEIFDQLVRGRVVLINVKERTGVEVAADGIDGHSHRRRWGDDRSYDGIGAGVDDEQMSSVVDFVEEVLGRVESERDHLSGYRDGRHDAAGRG